MKPFYEMPERDARAIRLILFDVDDTVTDGGKLTEEAYGALWALHRAGYRLVPVTGRPAGWCDMMLRQWPVEAVVCENGAFALYWDEQAKIQTLVHPNAAKDPGERLMRLRDAVFAAVPGARLARDQFSRRYDLAFDFAEDEPWLPENTVQAILTACRREGAACKLSSIHINAWYGDYDKLSTSLLYFERARVLNPRREVLFFGDSPNDEPMFAFFPNACGVENVLDFAKEMEHLPTYFIEGRGGHGFANAAGALLKQTGGRCDSSP